MIRLHHVPWGRSFRVLWLLCEMGMPPDEIIRYRIGDRAMRGPGLMGVSPAGRIPALEIDGITVFESGAIVQYLCETREHLGLGRPPGDAERVRYLEALGFAETQASLIEQLNLNHLFLRPPARPSATVVKLNTLRLADTLRALEGMVAGDYLLPSGFSGADAMLGFNLFAAPYYVRMDPYPGLLAYWARLQARPGFQAAAAIEGPQEFYAKAFYEVPVDG
ncbi:glutathione S-transferase family protein [Roseicyclus mahoneyensis]|uniref:Glutathione S-transferase n=1 Tax=Roseicyclus mahoneyensis TaxID=164332 RepID=A0A316GNM3_9RHOB|nr:glutathione S-transferase [Roseicyclus mahoneyensis]PWK61053.1 glutathione S-transferase [Roseicyclus mahoneyensis]